MSPITNATLRPGKYMMDMARSPSSTNVHMTLSKNFTIAKGMRMQVRAEAFNVLNMKNYNSPELRVNNANFGRITGASGSRSFQFSSRFNILRLA